MGIADLLGLGKNKKDPFRPPRAAVELRTQVETETRENFPSLARYREIESDARSVYKQLDDLIAGKQYAEDASRMKEELRRKLEGLAEKIRRNMSGAGIGGGQDYVEKNIDYLQRKSIRNSAKTLFTDFLEAHDAFMTLCGEGRQGGEKSLDAATEAMVRNLSTLNAQFFKEHGQDKEIEGLKEKSLARMAELLAFIDANKGRFEQSGVLRGVEACAVKLRQAAGAIASR